jgi:D-alanine-D-alanine ligase
MATLFEMSCISLESIYNDRRRSGYGEGMPFDPGTHIALVFGGCGEEHSISCVSAKSVLQALADLGHEVVCIGITRGGNWVEVPSAEVASYVITADHHPEVVDRQGTIQLVMNAECPGVEINGEFIAISVVFPVVHGVGGEDGAIQGLCQSMGIPVVGSGVRASAICMNKLSTKELVRAAGIDSGSWFGQKNSPAISAPVTDPFPFPWFVKPVTGGSSIGITRIESLAAYEPACREAFLSSSEVIVEQGLIRPRELEVGILVGEDGVKASPVGEIKIKEDFEYYDFDAKYISDGAELIVPALLQPHVAHEVQQLAIRIFELLGCAGYARIDFFLDGERIVFNEVNTIPGFTPISMFARMWSQAGIGFPHIVNQLVRSAS